MSHDRRKFVRTHSTKELVIKNLHTPSNPNRSSWVSVQVDIYFTAIGLFTIPDEKELQKLMDEIRENPQKYKLSA